MFMPKLCDRPPALKTIWATLSIKDAKADIAEYMAMEEGTHQQQRKNKKEANLLYAYMSYVAQKVRVSAQQIKKKTKKKIDI